MSPEKGLSAEEKQAQIDKSIQDDGNDDLAKVETKQPVNPNGDLDTISPDSIDFKLGKGDREKVYKIEPLPIKKQKLIIKMTKLNQPDEESLDQLVDIVCGILDEGDRDFIECG